MNFLSPYHRKEYLSFLQSTLLTDSFTRKEESLDLEFKPQFLKKADLIGRDKNLELDIWEIVHESENDPRVGISKDIFRLMAKYGTKRLLAIIISPNSANYRLSLATIELTLDGSKVKKHYSNPRRYSFFLGPESKIHTPEQFLIKKGRVDSFVDLLSRFSVEIVNKEFYNQIAYQFSELVGGQRKVNSQLVDFKAKLKLPSTNDHRKLQEFAVRLIGRLVFCWFLKKKKSSNGIPLIDEAILSSLSVKTNADYYHSVLENLFFQILNTPITDRLDDFKKGSYKNIPFLNGGLFEPHEDDFYRINEKSGRPIVSYDLKIPDKWFIAFYEILETYNFTIDENTSVDIDLSVDPEMLGRIFENLLAEINPETGETARKSTGSYYTPRQVVEFMVDESLKLYLHTKTKIDKERLSLLVSYSSEDVLLSNNEKYQIVTALDEVKIIDPACGSGAFPIGVLQKMLLILQKVDPKSILWFDKMLEKVDKTSIRNNIKEKFKDENLDFIRKLGIIQDAIYGVDIQTIAVEISKLRCFLTLIVDEEVDDSRTNRGIIPLPNLEFKFVAANTLLSLQEKEFYNLVQLANAPALRTLKEKINTLQNYKNTFFQTNNISTKLQIQKDYKNLQTDIYISTSSLRKGYPSIEAFLNKVIMWNPFNISESSNFFNPQWMYGIQNGFDIVIGNPPYLESRSPNFDNDLKNELQKAVKDRWGSDSTFISRGSDLLIYFYERAISLVANNGHIIFITQNAWLDTDYGKNFQEFLLKHTCVNKIIDSEFKHFDSKDGPNINTVITIFQGSVTQRDSYLSFIQYINKLPNNNCSIYNSFDLEPEIKKYKMDDEKLSTYKWGILLKTDNFFIELLEIMDNLGERIEKVKPYQFTIGQGLNLTKDCFASYEIIKKEQSLREIALPILTSDDGAPFILNNTQNYLIPKSKSKSIQRSIADKYGIKLFDDESTSKIPPVLILPRGIGRHFCSFNNIKAYSASFVDIYENSNFNSNDIKLRIWLFLNSSLCWLIREISGRKNLGGGMLKAEATDLKTFPLYFPFQNIEKIKSIYNSVLQTEVQSPLNELKSTHHKQIDEVVFDFLGISNEKRVLYLEMLYNMISTRTNKSKT